MIELRRKMLEEETRLLLVEAQIKRMKIQQTNN
jgi:hypothetical protein